LLLIDPITSPWSGKRPSFSFEKTKSPSTTTSKQPPLEGFNSDSTPKFDLISSARPAALG
jgi:hypothetical protein